MAGSEEVHVQMQEMKKEELAAEKPTEELDDVSSSNSTSTTDVDTAKESEGEEAALATKPVAEGINGPVVVRVEVKTCTLCSSKKPRALGCENFACKKCCINQGMPCSVHRKVKDISTFDAIGVVLDTNSKSEPQKTKKPVLRNEFKESNFSYYDETVTIFCVRDFFQSKKLSQGILNDQVRSQRVNGSYVGQQHTKQKQIKSPELKASIKRALEKTPLTVLDGVALKRPAIEVNGTN